MRKRRSGSETRAVMSSTIASTVSFAQPALTHFTYPSCTVYCWRRDMSADIIFAVGQTGVLAVTRSLGDSSMKEFVVGSPYTTETRLGPYDDFLIVACDGVSLPAPDLLPTSSRPLLPLASPPTRPLTTFSPADAAVGRLLGPRSGRPRRRLRRRRPSRLAKAARPRPQQFQHRQLERPRRLWVVFLSVSQADLRWTRAGTDLKSRGCSPAPACESLTAEGRVDARSRRRHDRQPLISTPSD